MGNFRGIFSFSKNLLLFLAISVCLLLEGRLSLHDFVCDRVLISLNKEYDPRSLIRAYIVFFFYLRVKNMNNEDAGETLPSLILRYRFCLFVVCSFVCFTRLKHCFNSLSVISRCGMDLNVYFRVLPYCHFTSKTHHMVFYLVT